jgi:hypothetical protein
LKSYLRHIIHRTQRVMLGDRCVGHVVFNVLRDCYEARNLADKLIGSYGGPSGAVNRLLKLAKPAEPEEAI